MRDVAVRVGCRLRRLFEQVLEDQRRPALVTHLHQFAAFFERERKNWAGVVAAGGVKID